MGNTITFLNEIINVPFFTFFLARTLDYPSPCQQLQAKLYKVVLVLMGVHTTKCADLALGLEQGCYNTAIQHCKHLVASYVRQWSSTMFVSIYSAYCGKVLAHIDPSSSVVTSGSPRKSGLCPDLLQKLLDGTWQPE